MIDTVANANPNTVVVLLCGSAVECPWANKVRAILYMGLPGQAGGEAIADLLYGHANPCGKLAESWPYTYEDVPSSEIYGKTTDALYQEGIYVGYRYYDKAGIAEIVTAMEYLIAHPEIKHYVYPRRRCFN